METAQAVEGYRAAIQMIAHEARVIWDSFRALLAANTILVGLAGAAFKVYPEFKGLTQVLSVLGIVMAVSWGLINARARDYYRYWFAWARFYEKMALGSEDHMIQCGRKFSDGESVVVLDSAKRMGWSSRLFRIEWLTYVVIVAFLVIYVYLLCDAV
jgi:hypothetical protein